MPIRVEELARTLDVIVEHGVGNVVRAGLGALDIALNTGNTNRVMARIN